MTGRKQFVNARSQTLLLQARQANKRFFWAGKTNCFFPPTGAYRLIFQRFSRSTRLAFFCTARLSSRSLVFLPFPPLAEYTSMSVRGVAAFQQIGGFLGRDLRFSVLRLHFQPCFFVLVFREVFSTYFFHLGFQTFAPLETKKFSKI